MRDSRAQLRSRHALTISPDARPAPATHPNDELALRLDALRESERERPERVAAAIGLLAFVIVACLAALGARAVLG